VLVRAQVGEDALVSTPGKPPPSLVVAREDKVMPVHRFWS